MGEALVGMLCRVRKGSDGGAAATNEPLHVTSYWHVTTCTHYCAHKKEPHTCKSIVFLLQLTVELVQLQESAADAF